MQLFFVSRFTLPPQLPPQRRYLLILLEGASDLPQPELGDRTALDVAQTPALNQLCTQGRVGQAQLIQTAPRPRQRKFPPQALPEIALATALGMKPDMTPARGPLEALGRNLYVPGGQSVMRVEALSVVDNRTVSVGVPNLTPAEFKALAERTAAAITTPNLRVLSAEHDCLILIDDAARDPSEVVCFDPWVTKPTKANKHIKFKKCLPAGGELGDDLVAFIAASHAALQNHDINTTRQELGQTTTTHFWPWGIGRIPPCLDWQTQFGLSAQLITNRPWAKGLGQWLQIPVIEPEQDTPSSFAQAALEHTKNNAQLTIVHLTQPAMHTFNSDISAKEQALRQIDQQLIKPLTSHWSQTYEEARTLVLPNIGADSTQGIYLSNPVPFAMGGHRVRSVVQRRMTEEHAATSDLQIAHGHELLEYFLHSGTRH